MCLSGVTQTHHSHVNVEVEFAQHTVSRALLEQVVILLNWLLLQIEVSTFFSMLWSEVECVYGLRYFEAKSNQLSYHCHKFEVIGS